MPRTKTDAKEEFVKYDPSWAKDAVGWSNQNILAFIRHADEPEPFRGTVTVENFKSALRALYYERKRRIEFEVRLTELKVNAGIVLQSVIRADNIVGHRQHLQCTADCTWGEHGWVHLASCRLAKS